MQQTDRAAPATSQGRDRGAAGYRTRASSNGRGDQEPGPECSQETSKRLNVKTSKYFKCDTQDKPKSALDIIKASRYYFKFLFSPDQA